MLDFPRRPLSVYNCISPWFCRGQEIGENGIKIYSLPDVDSDEDEDYKIQVTASLKCKVIFKRKD